MNCEKQTRKGGFDRQLLLHSAASILPPTAAVVFSRCDDGVDCVVDDLVHGGDDDDSDKESKCYLEKVNR